MPRDFGPNENLRLTRSELDDCHPQRSGDRVRAFCPFHGSDHQRSLSVDLQSGWFRCFACGAWGLLREAADDFRRADRRFRGARFQVEPAPDFGPLAKRRAEETDPRDLERFAANLGVSFEALKVLGTFWCQRHGAFGFPMTSPAGTVVGIRLRSLAGRKWAVAGSKQGLFVPTQALDDDQLLLPEGPTDTAALLTLGFTAIGRPNSSGGASMATAVARGRDVVVVGDDDDAGRRGAESLASTLMVSARSVRVIYPPNKDARQWIRTGARREDVEGLIACTQTRSLRWAGCQGRMHKGSAGDA